jgi:hypothetical protein
MMSVSGGIVRTRKIVGVGVGAPPELPAAEGVADACGRGVFDGLGFAPPEDPPGFIGGAGGFPGGAGGGIPSESVGADTGAFAERIETWTVAGSLDTPALLIARTTIV